MDKPKWDAFFKRMNDLVDFKITKQGMIFNCHGNIDKKDSFVSQVIDEMGLSDERQEILSSLRRTGGNCDCNVIFNSFHQIE